jgi:hypothetical protein
MSRIPEGECDDIETQRRWALQRANTARQIRSKHGQAFLRELLAAMEALPEKRLIEGAIAKDGAVCSLGALALKRRVDAGEDRQAVLDELASKNVDPESDDFDGDYIWDWAVAALEAPSLIAWEIPSENDDGGQKYVATKPQPWTGPGGTKYVAVYEEITAEDRYRRMVRWIRSQIKEDP